MNGLDTIIGFIVLIILPLIIGSIFCFMLDVNDGDKIKISIPGMLIAKWIIGFMVIVVLLIIAIIIYSILVMFDSVGKTFVNLI